MSSELLTQICELHSIHFKKSIIIVLISQGEEFFFLKEMLQWLLLLVQVICVFRITSD